MSKQHWWLDECLFYLEHSDHEFWLRRRRPAETRVNNRTNELALIEHECLNKATSFFSVRHFHARRAQRSGTLKYDSITPPLFKPKNKTHLSDTQTSGKEPFQMKYCTCYVIPPIVYYKSGVFHQWVATNRREKENVAAAAVVWFLTLSDVLPLAR